jgi:hypothetical protein
MKQTRRILIGILAALALAGLALSGCAAGKAAKPAKPAVKKAVKKAAPKAFACAPRGKLVRAVAPEAKLAGFTCYFAKYKKVKSLWFKVTLKNVSNQPQRFRVHIYLDNGKAVGGLIPRKTKKGLVKPGATASFKYPVKGMSVKPGGVTLIVKTASH